MLSGASFELGFGFCGAGWHWGVDMWALNLLIHPVSSWSRLHCIADPADSASCLAAHTVCALRWTRSRQGVSGKAGRRPEEP